MKTFRRWAEELGFDLVDEPERQGVPAAQGEVYERSRFVRPTANPEVALVFAGGRAKFIPQPGKVQAAPAGTISTGR